MSNFSNQFIYLQKKIKVANLENLYLYACQYDLSLFQPDLFNQYGIVYSEYINKAVDKRQAEYLAGRYSAKLALKELGIKEFDILSGRDRNPVWPKGIIGSISHTVDKAYAAAGYCSDFNYIGIDYEQIMKPNTAESIKSIIISDEENELLLNSGFDFETTLTIIFSAKESLFKALYSSVGKYFDFSAAEIINISKANQSFELRLTQSLSSKLLMGSCFKGWFHLDATNILTVIAEVYID